MTDPAHPHRSSEDDPPDGTTDPNVGLLQYDGKRSHVHIRGFFGDGGENEGVLSVIAVLDGGPHYPESGLIAIGSPQQSPLLDGYIPDLGLWSCSPEAAERLIEALQHAVRDVRKSRSR